MWFHCPPLPAVGEHPGLTLPPKLNRGWWEVELNFTPPPVNQQARLQTELLMSQSKLTWPQHVLLVMLRMSSLLEGMTNTASGGSPSPSLSVYVASTSGKPML